MTYLSDWSTRLTMQLEAARRQPFLWGQHDCCLFAASCVEAITGEDPMAEFRGHYDDRDSALEALKNIGQGTLFATMKAKFSDPVSIAQAQRGDIVFYMSEDGPSLGIAMGALAFFVGEEGSNEGLITLPMQQDFKIFKVKNYG